MSPCTTLGVTPAAAARPLFVQARSAASPLSQKLQHALAGGRHALRRRAGKAHAGNRSLGLERARRAHHHAQDHAAGGQRVVGDPIDEAADFGGKRWRLEGAVDGPETVVADRGIGRVVPDDADHAAGAERHVDDIAGLAAGGSAIGIGCGHRHRNQHRNGRFAGHALRISLGSNRLGRADDGPGFG